MKLGLFFPTALALLVLWLGGMWMWLYPLLHKRKVRRRKAWETRRVPPPL